MLKDRRGLTMSTASAHVVDAFDHAIDSYLGYRADTPDRVETLLGADPGFGLAHSLKGCLLMMAFQSDFVAPAQAELDEARRCGGTVRELAHADALARWIDGDFPAAIAVWDQILDEHPRDILAFRLAHFLSFWQGRPDDMLRSVRAIEPHWSATIPGYASILACRCFALEEAGHFLEAEYAGREAIRLDPNDTWAAHAVAHVLEMTGRRAEGIAWIETLESGWRGANNLKHHLWWHQAMYHLELGDFERVLSLYDTGFRDMGSPLTMAVPDLYIDVQNAASMLFRLGRHGIDGGDRWTELADKAETRIGDCLSAFTLPHWMMALAKTGREKSAEAMLASMRDFGHGTSPQAPLVRDVARPVCQAVLFNAQGRHRDVVTTMRPVIGEMWRLGGSHAQQDVLEQLFLDSALGANSESDIRLMMQRAAGRHPVPPSRRIGYAMAASYL